MTSFTYTVTLASSNTSFKVIFSGGTGMKSDPLIISASDARNNTYKLIMDQNWIRSIPSYELQSFCTQYYDQLLVFINSSIERYCNRNDILTILNDKVLQFKFPTEAVEGSKPPVPELVCMISLVNNNNSIQQNSKVDLQTILSELQELKAKVAELESQQCRYAPTFLSNANRKVVRTTRDVVQMLDISKVHEFALAYSNGYRDTISKMQGKIMSPEQLITQHYGKVELKRATVDIAKSRVLLYLNYYSSLGYYLFDILETTDYIPSIVAFEILQPNPNRVMAYDISNSWPENTQNVLFYRCMAAQVSHKTSEPLPVIHVVTANEVKPSLMLELLLLIILLPQQKNE